VSLTLTRALSTASWRRGEQSSDSFRPISCMARCGVAEYETKPALRACVQQSVGVGVSFFLNSALM
jgi:hypothetical protein